MQHPVADTPATTHPSILVVDDEPLYLELIADILGADYEILCATDGMAALEVAGCRVPHLVLLDLLMPCLDGYEVYSRMKADPRTCEIPVIFITGLGDVAAETRGLQLGAADYITKPITPELLRARVKTQIQVKLTRDKFALLSATDGLTGLANRSHFDSMLAYEYARHVRSGTELSLILLDIDHFKAFNDTYGHVRGDDCLRRIALAMTTVASRATDLVARYGGEEFVLLLPETHLKGAVILAEKVRKCISDLAIPHRHSCTDHVTASLGVACARLLPDNQIADLVEMADAQLYVAKAGGRNRVAFHAREELELTLERRQV
jgi:diguanylate cyclase (GGDEF)-like protein